MFFVCSNHSI